MALEDRELANIQGGAVKFGVWIAIGSAVTLVIGIIDGILRPLKCNR